MYFICYNSITNDRRYLKFPPNVGAFAFYMNDLILKIFLSFDKSVEMHQYNKRQLVDIAGSKK